MVRSTTVWGCAYRSANDPPYCHINTQAKQKEESINNHPSPLDEMFLTHVMKSVAILWTEPKCCRLETLNLWGFNIVCSVLHCAKHFSCHPSSAISLSLWISSPDTPYADAPFLLHKEGLLTWVRSPLVTLTFFSLRNGLGTKLQFFPYGIHCWNRQLPQQRITTAAKKFTCKETNLSLWLAFSSCASERNINLFVTPIVDEFSNMYLIEVNEATDIHGSH